MKPLIKTIGILLIIIYPFIVFFGLEKLSLRYIGLLIIFIFLLRLLTIESIKHNRVWMVLTILGILLTIIGIFSNSIIFIQLYPIFVSLALLGIFTFSLFQQYSFITRIAMRFSKDPLPGFVINYTRNVTIVWCIFFIFNSIISVFTVISGSISLWTFYNGFLSYIFIGSLVVAELIVRRFVKNYYEQK